MQIGSYKIVTGHVKYSIGNTVNNMVITVYGIRWIVDLSGGSLRKLYKCLTTILYT